MATTTNSDGSKTVKSNGLSLTFPSSSGSSSKSSNSLNQKSSGGGSTTQKSSVPSGNSVTTTSPSPSKSAGSGGTLTVQPTYISGGSGGSTYIITHEDGTQNQIAASGQSLADTAKYYQEKADAAAAKGNTSQAAKYQKSANEFSAAANYEATSGVTNTYGTKTGITYDATASINLNESGTGVKVADTALKYKAGQGATDSYQTTSLKSSSMSTALMSEEEVKNYNAISQKSTTEPLSVSEQTAAEPASWKSDPSKNVFENFVSWAGFMLGGKSTTDQAQPTTSNITDTKPIAVGTVNGPVEIMATGKGNTAPQQIEFSVIGETDSRYSRYNSDGTEKSIPQMLVENAGNNIDKYIIQPAANGGLPGLWSGLGNLVDDYVTSSDEMLNSDDPTLFALGMFNTIAGVPDLLKVSKNIADGKAGENTPLDYVYAGLDALTFAPGVALAAKGISTAAGGSKAAAKGLKAVDAADDVIKLGGKSEEAAGDILKLNKADGLIEDGARFSKISDIEDAAKLNKAGKITDSVKTADAAKAAKADKITKALSTGSFIAQGGLLGTGIVLGVMEGLGEPDTPYTTGPYNPEPYTTGPYNPEQQEGLTPRQETPQGDIILPDDPYHPRSDTPDEGDWGGDNPQYQQDDSGINLSDILSAALAGLKGGSASGVGAGGGGDVTIYNETPDSSSSSSDLFEQIKPYIIPALIAAVIIAFIALSGKSGKKTGSKGVKA